MAGLLCAKQEEKGQKRNVIACLPLLKARPALVRQMSLVPKTPLQDGKRRLVSSPAPQRGFAPSSSPSSPPPREGARWVKTTYVHQLIILPSTSDPRAQVQLSSDANREACAGVGGENSRLWAASEPRKGRALLEP